MVIFDSMNPYESLQVLVGSSPEELATLLKQIRTPIKIIAITQHGMRQAAYIIGDLRVNEPKQKKPKIKES